MGGRTEFPAQKGQKELFLVTAPALLSPSETLLEETKKEFPNLEIKFVLQKTLQATAGEAHGVPDELYAQATALYTFGHLPARPSLIPKVTFIQLSSAGINHIANHPIYTDSQIPLCSANGIHGPQIAEWVVMMDLVHHHRFVALYEQQKKREWRQMTGMGTTDAVGRRVGILGYGSVGRQVARVCKAMGMDVLAYTASPRKTPESRRDDGFIVPGTGDPDGSFPSAWYSGLDKESLHKFLSQEIDLLVLAVPLTPATTHFISAPEFALLHASNPRGTFVANIARGGIVDTAALITALETKQIRGAAVDTTDPEPLPEDHPLWGAPNILITPHVSGSTTVYADRAFQVARENLRRVRDGRKLINEVDRDRGY